MGKLLPAILAIAGLGAGTGAGYFLKPAAMPESAAESQGADAEHGAAPSDAPAPGAQAAGDVAEGGMEYVKLSNQFVIPVVEDADVTAMVVIALSLEVTPGSSEAVFAREPRLRDSFLRVLFDHANAGGFDGNFTRSDNLAALRRALLETARMTLGPAVSDVLVIDILRQDT